MYKIGSIVLSTSMLICSTGSLASWFYNYHDNPYRTPGAGDMFTSAHYGILPFILPAVLGLIGVLATVINNNKIVKLALISLVVAATLSATVDIFSQFINHWELQSLYIIYEATEMTFIALIIWVIQTQIQEDEKTDPLL